MNDLLTTERSEVVPFLRAVRAMKRGREATPQGGRSPPFMVAKRPYIARGLPSIRQFFAKKLSQTSMDWNETWQECSLDQAGRFVVVAFAFCHQGAELFSAEGENFGVLAISE